MRVWRPGTKQDARLDGRVGGQGGERDGRGSGAAGGGEREEGAAAQGPGTSHVGRHYACLPAQSPQLRPRLGGSYARRNPALCSSRNTFRQSSGGEYSRLSPAKTSSASWRNIPPCRGSRSGRRITETTYVELRRPSYVAGTRGSRPASGGQRRDST
jgi:hypothetical protein